jgi:peroxiredoxin
MTRSLVALLLTFAATTAAAALEEGAAAPDFTAPAALAGKAFTYSLAEARAKGPVVVYFYPSAYTGGCNIQARAFADHKADFDAAGASVVGVSLDSIARLEDFSADPEYCGGKVAVASDADGSIAKRYGRGHARPGNRPRLHRAHHVRRLARRQGGGDDRRHGARGERRQGARDRPGDGGRARRREAGRRLNRLGRT